MSRSLQALTGAIGGALAFGFGASVCVAADADFYKGQTLNYVVATSPGGGYDRYGRLVAEHMQKRIPGVTIVVRNMPGAAHIIGANFVYNSKPDGLTIGTFNTGLTLEQVTKAEGIKFDLAKMTWIGKAASDPRMLIISTFNKDITTIEDLRKRGTPIKVAVNGTDDPEVKILEKAMKLNVRLLAGYNGNDDQMAMRRGEIIGTIASRSSSEDFVKNGYGRFIAQIGGKDASLPQVSSFAKDPAAKSLVALIQSQGEISRLTAGPPGIAAPQLEALRAAYKKALDDPELQAKAIKADRPVDPAVGDEVAKMVQEALNQTPQTIALLKDALNAKPAALTAKGPLEVQDKGRKIVVKGSDGKPITLEPSGSRTKITVAGKEGTRNDLKSGLNCEVTYAQGNNEPSAIACQ